MSRKMRNPRPDLDLTELEGLFLIWHNTNFFIHPVINKKFVANSFDNSLFLDIIGGI